MIPSLVAEELQHAIVEYLSTTFALSDDEVRLALEKFLIDPDNGIFRGPYLRVRTPFKQVDSGWRPPLDWFPEGFTPYLHQAAAFERLSSRDHQPEPTVVTTGTGSGKTEAFLYPILDHCFRARVGNERGIKALILYPMNALATDQARRLAQLLIGDRRLNGITGALYIGQQGSHKAMGPNYLMDDRHAIRAQPPDILLTNYKMLDFLLLRKEDHDLWADNDPETLAYVVLDEFHTYDGAQGTDVAMLLRRLGATLKMATDDAPLGSATPVATSATLGSGPIAVDALREFAGRVFGTAFPDAAVIGEERQTPEEACGAIDYTLPIPEIDDVLAVPDKDLDSVAALFTGSSGTIEPMKLGQALLRHPLTRAVLSAVGDRSREWGPTVEVIVSRALMWGPTFQQDPAKAHRVVVRYLGLLSIARRASTTNGADRPLFAVEVQLWVREVSRLLRSLSQQTDFRWLDSAVLEGTDEEEGSGEFVYELPAVYCRNCGRAGWMAVASELDGSLLYRPPDIYKEALKRSGRVRTLIRASIEEPDARYLDVSDRQFVSEPNERTIAVLATGTEAEAERSQCPSCRAPESIRFLGTQVASLASVSISQMFGSPLVGESERKLLAFTDSVQDASHRAAFFAGRTYRFNARTAMARVIDEPASLNLSEIGDRLMADADSHAQSAVALYALVPPDLLRHPQVSSVWGGHPSSAGRATLTRRLDLEAALELGLRSRVGRTLELTGTVAAEVRVDDIDALAELAAEAHEHLLGQRVLSDTALGYRTYVRGLLERLRLQGGVFHPWLETYVLEGGHLYRIWGGRVDGMPPFTERQSRPVFLIEAPSNNFDSLTALSSTPTWVVDWARRTLALEPHQARDLNRKVFELMAHQGVVASRKTHQGVSVYGLDPEMIEVHSVPDDEASIVRCVLCASRVAVPPKDLGSWIDGPCLRYRCPGRYEALPLGESNYYRALYRSGQMRRVVTAEHTGLLERREREDLETAFKSGGGADAPNVVVCTPTLELGIDIGDLSAVLLASVPPRPASYVQRVGRAGRASGNSLITTFVRTDPHGLYHLAQPEHMISGEVRPPNCYLDAAEILRRQYFAYLIDRTAEGTIAAPPMPREIGHVMATGLDPEGWMRAILDASSLNGSDYTEAFLYLFDGHVTPKTAQALRDYAVNELELAVKTQFSDWNEHYAELTRRRDRLKTRINELQSQPHLEEEQERELRRLKGERKAVADAMQRARGDYTPSALEAMGLLPNYTLMDEAATLEASLWWQDEDDNYSSQQLSYSRPAALALTEFAPGNSFYAGGHRLLIDSLDIGTSSEPLYETWRICPECSFGAVDDGLASWTTCPRCHRVSIADTGAKHRLLKLRHVYSSSSEEGARVFDESDERERQRYVTATTIDVDPIDVQAAWKHKTVTFGMERARNATIRFFNFGPADKQGEAVHIAGEEYSAHRFHTCRLCGSVYDTRKPGDIDHHGWCLVRSGRKEKWDDPVLFHEVRTEAIRLLLPVASFEIPERLSSFKAALLLGLRLDLGGDPEHLRVTTSHFPGEAGGQGRRRFLVVHDAVPGGTGYLDRIADPERLGSILKQARQAISLCPCREEGRVACHRCLLGTVDRWEIELVSRGLAIELLEELLQSWEFEAISTVAEVGIGAVEESELERRFRVALKEWAGRSHNEAVLTPRPGSGPREALELRLTDEAGETRRYLIEEQVRLDTAPASKPDFLITRQDAPGPRIAVECDGYQFHATLENNGLASDTAKRQGVRASGDLVWNLTWEDVKDFHDAATSELHTQAPDRPLLPLPAHQKAELIHHARHRSPDVDWANRNSMRLLLDFLRRPDMDEWEGIVLSVAGGMASAGVRSSLSIDEVSDAISAGLFGGTLPPGNGGAIEAFQWVTTNGLAITALLDGRGPGGFDHERWTVISALDDGEEALSEPRHRARWQEWVRWANLLQFLRTEDRQGFTTVTSRSGMTDIGEFFIVPAHVPVVSATDGQTMIDPDTAEELGLADPSVRTLLESVVKQGAPVPVIGFEPEGEGGTHGWVVEAAWPNAKIAVLIDSDKALTDWLQSNGWTVRAGDAWTESDLAAALGVSA